MTQEDQDFATFAYESILKLASEREQFSADDVFDAMKDSPLKGDIRMWFVRAEIAGIIERTESFVRSRRKKQHGRHLRIWRSVLLCPAGERRRVSTPVIDERITALDAELREARERIAELEQNLAGYRGF